MVRPWCVIHLHFNLSFSHAYLILGSEWEFALFIGPAYLVTLSSECYNGSLSDVSSILATRVMGEPDELCLMRCVSLWEVTCAMVTEGA